MTIPAVKEDLIKTLIDGAIRVFRNSEMLFFEAELLAKHGAIARAFLLNQISLEECGKLEMICAATTSLLGGGEIDMKRLERAFRSHESKNKSNAYFLPETEEEDIAFDAGDHAASNAAFKLLQQKFHEESNTLKNSSLYVKFDEKFSSPHETITADLHADIVQRNIDFLSLSQPKVEMLTRWKDDLAAAVVELQEIRKIVNIEAFKSASPENKKILVESLIQKIKAIAE